MDGRIITHLEKHIIRAKASNANVVMLDLNVLEQLLSAILEVREMSSYRQSTERWIDASHRIASLFPHQRYYGNHEAFEKLIVDNVVIFRDALQEIADREVFPYADNWKNADQFFRCRTAARLALGMKSDSGNDSEK